MAIDKKIAELRQDYRFYIRCKRVVYKKPKLQAQIDALMKETESRIKHREFIKTITNR